MRQAVLLLVALGCSGTSPQSPDPPRTPTAPEPTATPRFESLPVDSSVKLGTLDNGLRYYVLRVQIGEYPGEAKTRGTLIIDAGASDETTAQKDAANKLNDAFAPILAAGIEGPDAGYTFVWNDRTEVTANTTSLAGTIDRLRKVAAGVVLDADNTASFYATWYRPDRMALVVVSPQDPNEVTREISRAFSSIKRPASPAPQRKASAPVFVPLQVMADPHNPSTAFALLQRMPHVRADSPRGFRERLSRQVVFDVLEQRLGKLTGGAGVVLTVYQDNDGADGVRVTVDGEVARHYAALLVEVERLRVHGVDADELAAWQSAATVVDPDSNRDAVSWPTYRARSSEAAVADAVAAWRKSIDAVNDTARSELEPSARHAGVLGPVEQLERLVGYARGDLAFPSPELEVQIIRSLTAADVKAAAAAALDASRGRTLRVYVESVTEADIRQADAAARATPPGRWSDAPHNAPLVAPVPGTIKSQRNSGRLKIFELGNGARVVLHASAGNSPDVYIAALGPGGWARVPADAAFEHWVSAEIVLASGLGDMKHEALERALLGRPVELTGNVWRYNHFVRAQVAPANLEVAFQALHLALTRPRKDPDSIARWRTNVEIPDANEIAMSAVTASLDALEGDPAAPLVTQAALDALDINRVHAAYMNHMGDMSTTVFLINGPVSFPAVESFIAKYLASIPSTGVRIMAKERSAAKVRAPTQIPGNPKTVIIQYIGARLAKSVGIDVIEADLNDLQWMIASRLDTSEDGSGITRDGRPFLRLVFTEEYPPRPGDPDIVARVKDELAELATPPEDLSGELELEVDKPNNWFAIIEQAVQRGADPVEAAIRFDKRYFTKKPLDTSGLRAQAKGFKKPVAVVRGVK